MRSKKSPGSLLSAVVLFVAVSLPFSAWNAEAIAPSRGPAAADAKITILQTTDVHHRCNGAGHVGFDVNATTAMSATGAYARIASYVGYVRATADGPVVLVDSGDFTMGTLYDLTLGQQPLALFFLDAMHYNCVTLGNHEFDYTTPGLAQILHAARTSFGFSTPIVATNMNLNGDTTLAPFVGEGRLIQTSRIEELPNGVKVGYLGLMGREAAITAPASGPVTFTDPASQYGTLQGLVDDMRNNKDVDVVIVLSHSGTDASGTSGEDVELARHVRGIDVIASGHTHTPLPTARTVTNGTWNTQIINAGAFGTHVFRLDLTYNAETRSTSLSASSNVPMTDATLTSLGISPSLAVAAAVKMADQALNVGLGPVFSQVFPDYKPSDLAKGVYHPVGVAAQPMISNEANAVLAPNGLGNLAADAVRTVPNGIIAQTLAAAGGDPSKLPGYDFNPFQIAVVATGVLRGDLPAGVPLTFADIYNVLPLGISPDTSQLLPVGYPLISAYLELEDVKKLCALQLLGQTNLAASQYYLNLSGIRYTLKPTESYAFFKFATAAAVLSVTSQKATGGSVLAQQALGAIAKLDKDYGASLYAAFLANNPYAVAMVTLNDGQMFSSHALENTAVSYYVAGAGSLGILEPLLFSRAIAAIDTVSGFAPTDANNTGAATALSSTSRVRVAADMYAVLLIGAVESEFGTAITAYKSATGKDSISASDMPGLLGNRINATPQGPGVLELKEWMALLSYVGSSLKGTISSDYASTTNFAEFGSFGAAVKNRNASYPLSAITGVVSTAGSLRAAH